MESNFLDIQHGGTHYKKLGMQPVEFIAANTWDFFSGSVLKYLTRWRDKGGTEDLKKALHFAQMRIQLNAEVPPTFHSRSVRMTTYVERNGIPEVEHHLFLELEVWVMAGVRSVECRARFLADLADYIVKIEPAAAQPTLF